MGHPLTLNVPESVYRSLVRQAEESGQQPEVLAVQLLTTATQPEAEDPLEAFIGAFASQGSDWADHHDAYLDGSIDTLYGCLKDLPRDPIADLEAEHQGEIEADERRLRRGH